MASWFGKSILHLGVILLCLLGSTAGHAELVSDVVVYGGTPAGVVAAVQVKQLGRSVALICPEGRLGGMTSSGLGQTDAGHKRRIGGLAREFYRQIAEHYSKPSSWKFQSRDAYQAHGGARVEPEDGDVMWTFEPSVAHEIFTRWVRESEVPVHFDQRLDRAAGVRMDGRRIRSIAMESGAVFNGRVYIDATYEGDLMAAAGVSYVVGREAADQYGETFNGTRPGRKLHQLKKGISPYLDCNEPASGLLPGIDPAGPGIEGQSDHRVQAYSFRLCLTDHLDNRRPIEKPADYDENKYELLFRNFEAGETEVPWICSPMPNRKTDINNKTGFSTDFIGQNYDYPNASYDERQVIVAAHRAYTHGLLWTLANHPRVPEAVRREVGRWGLCRDEFRESGGWPPQLYVREARRMVSDYVMTQHDCEQRTNVDDSVGMASFMMDSHHVQRYIDADGNVQNEGDVQEWQQMDAYPISYRSIVPKRGECENLLAPVCLSASHIAFGSIRMEPVFMILGQSAATAAVHAIDDGVPVQAIAYPRLADQLRRERQILGRN
jgi:hypothetical protein